MVSFVVYNMDCLKALKKMGSGSVDCVFTSPPYWGLRDYGTATWEGGNPECEHLEAKEKSRYDYSLESSTVQKPTEGTDAPRWKGVCPSCGAKKVDKQLGLESTFQEYVENLLLVFDEVKRVLKPSGTCWVNLGDTYNSGRNNRTDGEVEQKINNKEKGRVSTNPNEQGLKVKSLCNVPARFSIGMQDRGWILRNTIVWHKPSCMPSSVKDRFTVDFEYVFFFTKNKKYFFEQQLEPISNFSLKDKRKDLGKFKYVGKNGDSRFVDGLNTMCGIKSEGRNMRCVWSINPKPYREAHFACFPPALVERGLKAGCPKEGVVLDPFVGSGTTLQVARDLGLCGVGVELNGDYVSLIRKRVLTDGKGNELLVKPSFDVVKE